MTITICLDFDGVIHSYDSGWKGVSIIPDMPVPGAIDAILTYLNHGCTVAIYSSRSRSFRGRRAMKRYIAETIWNDPKLIERVENELTMWPIESFVDIYGIVKREFKWPWFKPPAFITIDDRAICFDGTFPSVEDIFAFKPWNKR